MGAGELARKIKPEETVLLLGAGASIPSGAPSGNALAKHLASRLDPPVVTDELVEVAGIFEHRQGRRALVDAVRARLQKLEPTGGLLAMPSFPWRAIYSTNFDQLVELAYARAEVPLRVIRSNYDHSRGIVTPPVLYKIHGCISQDVADGHKARMVLTEADYDDVQSYRQALLNSLAQAMVTADTVIIGQSLTDRHLRDLAKEVAKLRGEGAPGRVFMLLYDYNDDQAQLLSRHGVECHGGSMDEFAHALGAAAPATIPAAVAHSSSSPRDLPQALLASTIDVGHAARLAPNVTRLFNGAPASYADIGRGLTITRAVERRLGETQNGTRGFFVVLAGGGGVGKTTLARAMLLKRLSEGFLCWEHSNNFPLDVNAWLEVEERLRRSGQQGVLLIDDCTRLMPAVNRLVDSLGELDRPFLRIVVTTNSAQWKTRTKSTYFFSRGTRERLSTLTDGDLHEIINLVDTQPAIQALVDDAFLHLPRPARFRFLRDRCSADMFVCLKNLFGTDSLDNILLQEFAELDDSSRDVYRHVAALQAMGTKVHRQLIVRLLGLDAGAVASLLTQMEDVVAEYDISVRDGLYGWAARHDVIAAIIATYKYADQDELYGLLRRLIDNLNPTMYMELETANAIASNDMGIARLVESQKQSELLERLIAVVPGERTPRRRLIRHYLWQDQLGAAERTIATFQREIGDDNIVNRYRALLAMKRSELVEGVLDEDRLAMLLEAERLAKQCVQNSSNDIHNYRLLAQVALSGARRFDDHRMLFDALEMMRAVEPHIPDPEFAELRRQTESQQRRLLAQRAEHDVVHLEVGTDLSVADVLLTDSE